MKLKYIGPFDAVEIPAVGGVVENGATFDAYGDTADDLLGQGDFAAADDEAEARAAALAAELLASDDGGEQGRPASILLADLSPEALQSLTVDQLRDLAERRGTDLKGLTLKDEIVGALVADQPVDTTDVVDHTGKA